MKFVFLVIIVTLFCNVQQFVPILCDDTNFTYPSNYSTDQEANNSTEEDCGISCILDKVLNFIIGVDDNETDSDYDYNNGNNGSSLQDYYYDSGPVEEEIIIIPLTSSGSYSEPSYPPLSSYDYFYPNENNFTSGKEEFNSSWPLPSNFSSEGLPSILFPPSNISLPLTPVTNTSASNAASNSPNATLSSSSPSGSGMTNSSNSNGSSGFGSGSGSGSSQEYGSNSENGLSSMNRFGISSSGAAISTSAPSSSTPSTSAPANSTTSSNSTVSNPSGASGSAVRPTLLESN